MSFSPACELRPLPGFERSYQELKRRFYRKNHQAAKLLEDVVAGVLTAIRTSPRDAGHGCEPYPWPRGSARPGWEFLRVKVRLPGLDGAAARGRIMYAYCHERKLVRPVWIYNHQQYPSRPTDEEIKSAIRNLDEGTAQARGDS